MDAKITPTKCVMCAKCKAPVAKLEIERRGEFKRPAGQISAMPEVLPALFIRLKATCHNAVAHEDARLVESSIRGGKAITMFAKEIPK